MYAPWHYAVCIHAHPTLNNSLTSRLVSTLNSLHWLALPVRDTKTLKTPLDAEQGNLFRVFRLDTLPFSPLIHLKSSFSQVDKCQKSSQTGLKVSLEKKEGNYPSFFSFLTSPEKKYNQHPEIWH